MAPRRSRLTSIFLAVACVSAAAQRDPQEPPLIYPLTSRGATPAAPRMRAVTSSSDIATVVADAKRTGATGLKLYADLSPDIIARIVREAHAQGLRVWSHATIFPARPSDAVAAGVDVISHSLLLY